MSEPAATEMTDGQIASFLGAAGTCVLSLAKDDTPYSIPVSYGFDAETGTFYLRLGFTKGNEKRAFLDASETARLLVYEESDAVTRSVVATGELTEVGADELTPTLVERLSRARLPLFELWGVSKTEIDFSIVRVEPARLTGRAVPTDRTA